jgi:hypothetical protein
LATPVDIAASKPQSIALPPPIIVLGTRPAATAVVGAMLGCNPAAFPFPYLNLFVSETLEGVLTTMNDASGAHVHGLLRALGYIYGSEQTIISIGMARRWVMRRLAWPTNRVFDELRSRVAPRRLIDKSAIYSRDAKCLERIRKTLLDADYVYVIEHPLTPGAVPLSRRGMSDAGRIGDAKVSPRDQVRWLQAQRVISEAMNQVMPERLAVLRMDALLADPHSALSDLCARLHLANDETAMAAMLHPENSPFAGFGPVGANLGDDPTFLRDPTFPPKAISSPPIALPPNGEQMLPEVAEFVARHGYD